MADCRTSREAKSAGLYMSPVCGECAWPHETTASAAAEQIAGSFRVQLSKRINQDGRMTAILNVSTLSGHFSSKDESRTKSCCPVSHPVARRGRPANLLGQQA